MRVLVLALAVALVAANQGNHVPEFIQGQTYIYKYEAEIMGGMPEHNLARAGVKILSRVLIRAMAENKFLMKMEDPQLFEYSGIWPKDTFTPATQLTTALANQLLTPVKFEYTNGVVGKVYAPAGLSENVLNTFKGILNMLQMNIKKTQNVYDLQELGSQGVCKTQYTITDDQKAERIYVTKTKDLNQCQDQIVRDIGLSYVHKCVYCVEKQKAKALRGAASFNYVLKEEATGARILEATVRELIQFSPFNIMNGAPQMESKQNLTFVEQKNVPVELASGEYLPRGSLKYVFDTELVQTPIHILRKKDIQMDQLLNHLVTSNKGKPEEDAPLQYIQFIQFLREARYEDIESLWRQYKDQQDHRHWILNAIPAIRTHAAVRFIKEKHVAGELGITEVLQAMLVSIHLVKADQEVINTVHEMIMDHKFQENPVLHQTVMLGYGTLIGKYCVENQACSPELMKTVHDGLTQAVESGKTEEIIPLLKVMGNAAHPASRKSIQKLLPGFGSAAANLHPRVHIEAVLALRNIAQKEPKMVQEIAVQLFMNKELSKELRMVAAMVLFETRLPMGLVMTMAHTVLNEKNLQLSSFVYSYMKSMTKSTAPDMASVAAACNVAVRILNPRLERMSYRYSRSLYMDAYSNPWMVGAAASAHYINEAATILPKSVVAKARTYLAGAYADVIEVGMRTEGIQDAILKSRNSGQTEDWETDRINRMRAIIKTLNAWRAEPSSEPLASVYVKFFGQEIAFANIDKPIVDKYIELAKQFSLQTTGKHILDSLEAGYNIHYAKPMMLAEIRRILPTAVGLPMEVSLYAAAVAAATVEVQASMTPRPVDNFQFSELLKSNMNMKASIIPSVSAHTYAVMGVNTAWIKAALMSRAKVHTVVPAKMEATISMVEGNFKLQLLPTERIHKIVSAEHETFAVVRSMEEARITPLIPVQVAGPVSRQRRDSKMESFMSSELSASSEILYDDRHEKRDFQLPRNLVKMRCSESETFGIKLCSETQVRNASYMRPSFLYSMIGKQVVEVTVTPAVGPVIEKIEIEVQVGEKSADKIIKVINMSEEEEITESRNILMKLKKILAPSKSHYNSSSSSSSRSRSSHSSSSSSSSSRSSKYAPSRARHADTQQAVKRTSQRFSKSSSSSSQQSSSSSSSRRSIQSKQRLSAMKFVKDHVHQHAVTADRVNSASSAYSFEDIYAKAKYLAKSVPPSMTVLIRGVRADQKDQGYQVTAYVDKATSRLQVIMTNLAVDDHERICMDGMLLSKHKMMTKIRWGIECRQHKAEIVAESGLVDQKPAARLKMSWDKLPRHMKCSIKRFSKYISCLAKKAGFDIAKIKHIHKQIKMTVALVSERRVNFVLQTCKRAIYRLGAYLPVTVPSYTSETNGYEWQGKISHMLLTANAAECEIVQDKLKTFNSQKFNSLLPNQCQLVLAQDCSAQRRFIVLLKKDHTTNQNEVTVHLQDLDIKLHMKDNVPAVMLNQQEVNVQDTYTTRDVTMKRTPKGIIVTSTMFGLMTVIYEGETVKVQVSDNFRESTCGLCGPANGEAMEGFRGPNKRLQSDPNNFAHSWVLSGDSCRDETGCFMRLESVKLEKQVNIYGQDSKCYSVDPVLRCLPGCMPVRTTTIDVGYHCVPAASYMNTQAGQSNMYSKSVDLRDPTEAHVACRCTPQCA